MINISIKYIDLFLILFKNLGSNFNEKKIIVLMINYNFSDRTITNKAENNSLNIYANNIGAEGDFVTDLGVQIEYSWVVN